VAVGQPLHEGAGAQAVGAVVGEVGLAQGVEARNGGHQVVVHPQTAHGVVGCGVNAHGGLEGILVGDLLIHGKQVAVALPDDVAAEALNGLGEVQVHRVAGGANPVALVAHGFGRPGGDVPGNQV